MPLMQWDETMSVGVAKLDEQHMMLVTMINDAFEMIQRSDRSSLSDLIVRMQDYANRHFETEEAAMRRCSYPETEAHISLHALFRQRAEEFQSQEIDLADMPEVFVFLSRWLTCHIMNEDKKYMPYLVRTPSVNQA